MRFDGSRIYFTLALLVLLLLVVVITIQNIALGDCFEYSGRRYTCYNNFVIFRESFGHLVSQANLYTSYPLEYGDRFKYSPTFALTMAPFGLVSPETGLLLWNAAGVVLLLWGMASLIADRRALFLLIVAMIPEIVNTVSNSQSNTHIVGLLLLCFRHLEAGNPARAALFLSATFFIKLFTLALAPAFLLYNARWKHVGWLTGVSVVLFALPAAIVGMEGLLWQYENWYQRLQIDHSLFSGMSVQGLAGLLNPLAPTGAVQAGGLILLLLPLTRIRMYADDTFRLMYFAMCLVGMVVLNHKAESPTYVIVLAATALYAGRRQFTRAPLYFLLATVVFTSLTGTDLVPRDLRILLRDRFLIKAVVPSIFAVYLFVCLMIRRAGSRAQELPGVLER